MEIRIENLTYSYCSPFSPVQRALSNIHLKIGVGEIVAIVGATGSGKTTLVQHLNGLLHPEEGRVFIDQEDLANKRTDLSEIRKKIGLVFQFPEIQLFEESVYADVAFGPRNMGMEEGEVEKRVCDSLNLVGLDFEKFRNVSPFCLSGGEKRRVAIAGILAMEPEILVLDEPTVGLDVQGAGMVEEILEVFHRHSRTVVFISHDMDLVARLAQRVVVLDRGRIAFDGGKTELFQNDELLRRTGLGLPHVCWFMKGLKDQGYPVSLNIFNVEEAKQELKKVFCKRK